MITVKRVDAHSPAAKGGVLIGDIIISVNGHEVNDVLDFSFYTSERIVQLKIHRGAELFDLMIKKGEYEDIGIHSDTFLMDNKKTCRNGCIFCFIDQNPDGMRETIYFKDDDSRLSFLHGSYVTLTNMTDADIDRIIAMHMSPVNISVHTTNPELRVMMMKNKNAGKVLSYLPRLAASGISVNCQIVLCKGVNDKNELLRTMSDLAALYPGVSSVSVVPCGLTKHRDGLYPLLPFEKEDALEVIETVDRFAEELKEKCGCRLFYVSDEFYLKAELPLPSEDYYDGYPQLENGVGMLTSLKDEFYYELEYLNEDHDTSVKRKVSLATGYAAYPLIKEMADKISELCPGVETEVFRIKNDFFGESVTVAGLVCGVDLLTQLRGKDLGDRLIIPSVMLRDEKDRFLDDMTLSSLEDALNVKIVCADASGADFISAILDN